MEEIKGGEKSGREKRNEGKEERQDISERMDGESIQQD